MKKKYLSFIITVIYFCYCGGGEKMNLSESIKKLCHAKKYQKIIENDFSLNIISFTSLNRKTILFQKTKLYNREIQKKKLVTI